MATGNRNSTRSGLTFYTINLSCIVDDNTVWHTSKWIQSRIWNAMIGIFVMWPPISCSPHILSSDISSGGTTRPLFQSIYLIDVDDEVASRDSESLWIAGLDHLVHTRNAKHSAIL